MQRKHFSMLNIRVRDITCVWETQAKLSPSPFTKLKQMEPFQLSLPMFFSHFLSITPGLCSAANDKVLFTMGLTTHLSVVVSYREILLLLSKEQKDPLKSYIMDGQAGEKWLPEVITGWVRPPSGRLVSVYGYMCACYSGSLTGPLLLYCLNL